MVRYIGWAEFGNKLSGGRRKESEIIFRWGEESGNAGRRRNASKRRKLLEFDALLPDFFIYEAVVGWALWCKGYYCVRRRCTGMNAAGLLEGGHVLESDDVWRLITGDGVWIGARWITPFWRELNSDYDNGIV